METLVTATGAGLGQRPAVSGFVALGRERPRQLNERLHGRGSTEGHHVPSPPQDQVNMLVLLLAPSRGFTRAGSAGVGGLLQVWGQHDSGPSSGKAPPQGFRFLHANGQRGTVTSEHSLSPQKRSRTLAGFDDLLAFHHLKAEVRCCDVINLWLCLPNGTSPLSCLEPHGDSQFSPWSHRVSSTPLHPRFSAAK